MGDEQAGPSRKNDEKTSNDGEGAAPKQPTTGCDSTSNHPQESSPCGTGASTCASLHELDCPTSPYDDDDLDLPALETPSPVLMPTQLLSPPIALHFEEALPLSGILPASINVSVNLHQPSAYSLSGPQDPVFLDDSMESGEREITITRNPYFDPSLSPGPADDFLSLATFDGHVSNFHFGLEDTTWVTSTSTAAASATNTNISTREVVFPTGGESRRKRPSTTDFHDANCAASKSKKPAESTSASGASPTLEIAEPTAGPSGRAEPNSHVPRSSNDGPVADDLQLECLTDELSTEDETSDDDIEVVSVRKSFPGGNSNGPPEIVDLTVSEDEAPTEGIER